MNISFDIIYEIFYYLKLKDKKKIGNLCKTTKYFYNNYILRKVFKDLKYSDGLKDLVRYEKYNNKYIEYELTYKVFGNYSRIDKINTPFKIHELYKINGYYIISQQLTDVISDIIIIGTNIKKVELLFDNKLIYKTDYMNKERRLLHGSVMQDIVRFKIDEFNIPSNSFFYTSIKLKIESTNTSKVYMKGFYLQNKDRRLNYDKKVYFKNLYIYNDKRIYSELIVKNGFAVYNIYYNKKNIDEKRKNNDFTFDTEKLIERMKMNR